MIWVVVILCCLASLVLGIVIGEGWGRLQAYDENTKEPRTR